MAADILATTVYLDVATGALIVRAAPRVSYVTDIIRARVAQLVQDAGQ